MSYLRHTAVMIVAGCVIAGVVGTPAAAEPSPGAGAAATVAAAKQALLTKVDERLTDLGSFDTTISGAQHLTSGHKQALTTALASARSGLTALRTRISAETTAAALAADAKEMTTGYRVYLLLGPQIRLTIAMDVEADVANQLATVSDTIASLIAKAKAAGQDTTQVEANLSDLRQQLSTARSTIAGKTDQLLAVKPGPNADSITAIVKTARVFGPNVELRRTLSSRLGENFIEVRDQFINRGNQPVPHCWLLHINFGYPLLEPGASTYCYKGPVAPRFDSAAWFKRKNFRAAPEPQEAHRGTGEVFAYIDPAVDAKGNVLAGVVNRKRGFGVKVEYNRKEYARLGNWQHWGPGGSYVGALP